MVIRQTQTFGKDWVVDKRIIKVQGEKDMVSSFENKLRNSNFLEEKDYFVSDDGHEGKVYTIVSYQLKKILCEIINPLLRINEWEVGEEEFIVKMEDYYKEDREVGSKVDSRYLTDEEARAMKVRDMEITGAKMSEEISVKETEKGELEKEKSNDKKGDYCQEVQSTKKDDNSTGGSSSGTIGKYLCLISLVVGLIGVVGVKGIGK
jgi:hypothetical protein